MSDNSNAINTIVEYVCKAVDKKLAENNKSYVDSKLNNWTVSDSQITDNSISGISIKDGTLPSLKIYDFTAQVASIALAQIDSAIIDTAQIENLSVYVEDVAKAVIDTAVIGTAILEQLVIKGQDELYYQISINEDGNVVASERSISAEEISAGRTSEGETIIESELTSNNIDIDAIEGAATVLADLLVSILAASDTYINKLVTPLITSPLGSGLDISSNEYLTLAVDSKNKTFRQTTAPTSGMVAGDLWIDSDDSNKLYRYSGTSWISVQDIHLDSRVSTAEATIELIPGQITLAIEGIDEFHAGSRISLTQDEALISAPVTVISVPTSDTDDTAIAKFDSEGVYADVISSPTIIPVYRGASTLYVDPSATDAQVESGNYFRSLGAALSNLNYKYMPYDVSIVIAQGVSLYEDVYILGICGYGNLSIGTDSAEVANYPIIYGKIYIDGCTNKINFIFIKSVFYGNEAGSHVSIEKSSFVMFEALEFTGNVNTTYMISATYGSKVLVAYSSFYNTSADSNRYCIYAESLAEIMCDSCIGDMGAATVFYTDAGKIRAASSMPSTTGTSSDSINNGEINITGCATDAGSTPTTYSEPTVYTYNIIASRSYRTALGWGTDNMIRQGYTTTLYEHYGAMFFDLATLRSDLAGATIDSATLSFTCTSLGLSYPRTLGLVGITNTTYSGAVSVAQNYGALETISWYESKTMTIPNQAIVDLVSGTINSLALYSGEGAGDLVSGKDYSERFRRCEGYGDAGAPVLTVIAS